MPRLPADIRISLKQRGGNTFRIELVRNPFNRRFWVRVGGKRSAKLPEATATEIADRIRRWLVGSLESSDQTALEFDTLRDLPIPPDD